MARRPGDSFSTSATAPFSNSRSWLLGRNSSGTVIGVDHSISRCKLSASETHIRALPVLPGPASGKRRPAATGPGNQRSWLTVGRAREGSEGNKGESGVNRGENRRRSQGWGLRAWLHPDADERWTRFRSALQSDDFCRWISHLR